MGILERIYELHDMDRAELEAVAASIAAGIPDARETIRRHGLTIEAQADSGLEEVDLAERELDTLISPNSYR
jgi:hypothetical protein